MKKYTSIFILIVFLLATLGFAFAQNLKPYTFLFTGRWQPAINPLLIEGDGFQDIQNLRRVGNQLKGVSGHTKINHTIINSTYKYSRNAFHFKKDNPSESHILVAANDEAQSNSRIYTNNTIPPYMGEFESTVVFTPSASPGKQRFSMAPQGRVIYSNQNQQKIWGGDNFPITAFITSTAAITNSVTNAKDATNLVTNRDSSQNITVNQASNGHFLIGTTETLQGVTIHLSTANTSTATITAKEWTGTAWSSLTITDNTTGLSESGTITWSSTASTSKYKYLEGYVLYWYQFSLSAGSAGIYYVTAKGAFQDIRNIWDHETVICASCKKYLSTGYVDYTDEINDDTTYFVAVLDSLATGSEYLFLGFLQPMQGFEISLVPGKENTTAATTLTVSYWNGTSWTAVSGQNDGTSSSSISLAQSGTISFSAIAKGTEYVIQFASEAPLYYYRLAFDKTLDSEVEIYYIEGIPATYPLSNYKFSELFQERAFLFCDQNGEKNKAIYSGFMQPYIWNGDDSGELIFGGDEELIAAKVLYNVYENEAVSQLIVTKKSETYRVFGDGPENWEVQRISSNIGCTAPLSMVACQTAGNRNFIIWQAGHGFVITDGATIRKISDDIDNYFDPNSSDYIIDKKIDDTVAWYDPVYDSYHALMSSTTSFDIEDDWGGSDDWESTYNDDWGTDWEESLITHNVELEYSLKYSEWTKIYREDASGARPLYVGFQVKGNKGKIYTYGLADDGYMYRLENGQTWNGTAIEQYVHTKNLLLDIEKPFHDHTAIHYLRLIHKKHSITGEDLAIAHYCEDTLTVSGSSNQDVPDAIDLGEDVYNTQDCTLGPCLWHSIKLTVSIDSVYYGLEPIAMMIYYEDYDVIFE